MVGREKGKSAKCTLVKPPQVGSGLRLVKEIQRSDMLNLHTFFDLAKFRIQTLKCHLILTSTHHLQPLLMTSIHPLPMHPPHPRNRKVYSQNTMHVTPHQSMMMLILNATLKKNPQNAAPKINQAIPNPTPVPLAACVFDSAPEPGIPLLAPFATGDMTPLPKACCP